MPMRQTLAADSWVWQRARGGDGGRGASSVQTKVRVGGTSRRWLSDAMESGRRSWTFSRRTRARHA